MPTATLPDSLGIVGLSSVASVLGLREWLVRAANFRVAYGTFGTGPTEESLVLMNASFFELKAAEREAEPRGQEGAGEEGR